MKQRIIFGVLGALLVIGTLVGIYTPVYPIFLMIVSGVAIFELESIANITNKALKAISIIFGSLVPLFLAYSYDGTIERIAGFKIHAGTFIVLYVMILLILSLKYYKSIRFNHIVIAVFASLVIPFGFATFVLVRDAYLYTGFEKQECFWFVFMAFSCAWITDTFAYFFGKKLGKHKMAPNISPKKTWEGAIAGVLGTVFVNLGLLAVFDKFYFDSPIVSYWMLIPISILLSIVGILGDLTASTIKRNYGIKDFGGIIPGHGGALDRFDSCLFTMPATYVVITIIDSVIALMNNMIA